MGIRKAEKRDIPTVSNLLLQVAAVHHNIRPDIFKPAAVKYSESELEKIFADEKTPVFVSVDSSGKVQGYAFCIINERENALLEKNKTVYIDDLCVDEACRGKHIGTELYEYVRKYAASINADSITLNVWEGNDSARAFYEKLGMKVQRTTMEKLLS